MNLGAGGWHMAISLARGLNLTVTLLDVPALPAGVPAGAWTAEGVFLGPDLGETLSRDVKPFSVVP